MEYTIKQLTKLTGCHHSTIRAKVTKLFPDKVQNGVRTILSEEEAILIIMELKKKGIINLTENRKELTENRKVDRLTRLENMVEKLIETIPLLINQPKQIEIKQDYYSILAYCNLKKYQITTSEAIRYGKEMVKLSKDKGLDVNKVTDERYGYVNSYHISVLEEVITL